MNTPDMTVQFCLMDWHGNLLTHDPMTDDLALTAMTPGTLPDLTVKTSAPFTLPTAATLIKHVSMPKAFPQLVMTNAGSGYVALFSPPSQHYLTCVPAPEHEKKAVIRADYILNWEKLIPLTHTAFRGLSLLMLPNFCAISHPDGSPVSALKMHHQSNIGIIDTYNVPLADNLSALDIVGQLAPGQAADITLKCSSPTSTLLLKVRCL